MVEANHGGSRCRPTEEQLRAYEEEATRQLFSETQNQFRIQPISTFDLVAGVSRDEAEKGPPSKPSSSADPAQSSERRNSGPSSSLRTKQPVTAVSALTEPLSSRARIKQLSTSLDNLPRDLKKSINALNLEPHQIPQRIDSTRFRRQEFQLAQKLKLELDVQIPSEMTCGAERSSATRAEQRDDGAEQRDDVRTGSSARAAERSRGVSAQTTKAEGLPRASAQPPSKTTLELDVQIPAVQIPVPSPAEMLGLLQTRQTHR